MLDIDGQPVAHARTATAWGTRSGSFAVSAVEMGFIDQSDGVDGWPG